MGTQDTIRDATHHIRMTLDTMSLEYDAGSPSCTGADLLGLMRGAQALERIQHRLEHERLRMMIHTRNAAQRAYRNEDRQRQLRVAMGDGKSFYPPDPDAA